jgi:hypothetical protein
MMDTTNVRVLRCDGGRIMLCERSTNARDAATALTAADLRH